MGKIFLFFGEAFQSRASHYPLLLVFGFTGPPQWVDYLALPHKDRGIPLKVSCPRTQQASLLGCSPTILFVLSTKQEMCEYHYLKSFGMT